MLKHISFAGIDSKTNLEELIELQKDFPIAEFGFLYSKNWEQNGNRYMNPENIRQYQNKGINLSLHLCGGYARGLLKKGDWSDVLEVFKEDLNIFNRIQLNVVGSKYKHDEWIIKVPEEVQEVIIQQYSFDKMPVFKSYLNSDKTENISILMDTSGGKGIYTKDFDIDDFGKDIKIGFAGGINPDNCIEVIERMENLLPKEINYWIDMEQGVRDKSDWFSLEKCRIVCERIHNKK